MLLFGDKSKKQRSHESGELKQNKRNITKNRRIFLLKVEDKSKIR